MTEGCSITLNLSQISSVLLLGESVSLSNMTNFPSFIPAKAPLTQELARPLVELLRSSDSQVQRSSTLAISNFALTGSGEFDYM